MTCPSLCGTATRIVIGASAGGIDAISRLLSQLPGDLSASVLVAIHVNPVSRPESLSAVSLRAATQSASLRPVVPPREHESAQQRDAQEPAWRGVEGERLLAGIGSSAGGLDALERLLPLLPADIPVVHVVVQHLDPQHACIPADLLGRATALPVAVAEDGQRVERDRVDVMPRHSGVIPDGRKLRLVANEPRSAWLPINGSLISLAEDEGENAIAIALSRAGSDGALVIPAVKRYGRLTVAQAPGEDGYKVARAMRDDPVLPGAFLISLTGTRAPRTSSAPWRRGSMSTSRGRRRSSSSATPPREPGVENAPNLLHPLPAVIGRASGN